MEKFDGTTAEDPKDSADSLDNINEEQVDHSQSAPADDEGGQGPSVSDAFRSGS